MLKRQLKSASSPSPKSQSNSSRSAGSRTANRVGFELLTGSALSRAGAHLMNLILTAANDRGLSMEETAEEVLGISPSHFYALRNGSKEVSQLGDEHINKVARFLGLSRVAAKLAAGQLQVADFFAEPDVARNYLRAAMQYIQSDPEFGPYVPASIVNLPESLQHLFVMLYERAMGRSLIPGRVSPEEIVKRHRQLLQSDGDQDS